MGHAHQPTKKILKMDEYSGRIVGHAQIETGWLGPCIGFGALYKGTGYLTHGLKEEDFDSMIDDINRDVTNKRGLRLYLAGGSISREFPKTDLADRNSVVRRIKQSDLGKYIVDTKWNKRWQQTNLVLRIGKNRSRAQFIQEDSDII